MVRAGTRACGQGLFAVVGVTLALLAGGCRLDLAVEVAIDADGGGQLGLSAAADPELAVAAGHAGVDPLGGLAEVVGDAADDWQVTEGTVGDGVREVRLTTDFAGPEEFDALAADLTEELAAPELALLDDLRLLVTDDRISVQGRAGLAPTPGVTELGYEVDEATARLADHVGYQLRITMPGEVLATTADERDARVLTWTVPAGEQVRVHATGERPEAPPSRLPPTAMIAVAVALLAVTGYALVVSLRRRSFSRRT